MQRKHKVIEPNAKKISSSDDEENLTLSAKKQYELLQKFIMSLTKDELSFEEVEESTDVKHQLVKGVLRPPKNEYTSYKQVFVDYTVSKSELPHESVVI